MRRLLNNIFGGENSMKRVMTVDDSATVRSCLETTLCRAGYQVVQATDGSDALNKLQFETVDVLVTDLNMPNMNGIDLIKKVRSLPGMRFMPIIMLTSEIQPELKQAGKVAGASGWVNKPFRPSQLLAVMQMICPTD
jgi:two-component system chemotaxis response regulator CheY